MSDQKQKPFNHENMRQRTFSCWENEDGAPASGHENSVTKTCNTENIKKIHNMNSSTNQSKASESKQETAKSTIHSFPGVSPSLIFIAPMIVNALRLRTLKL